MSEEKEIKLPIDINLGKLPQKVKVPLFLLNARQ